MHLPLYLEFLSILIVNESVPNSLCRNETHEVIKYLEFCVHRLQNEDPGVHNLLLSLYVKKVEKFMLEFSVGLYNHSLMSLHGSFKRPHSFEILILVI